MPVLTEIEKDKDKENADPTLTLTLPLPSIDAISSVSASASASRFILQKKRSPLAPKLIQATNRNNTDNNNNNSNSNSSIKNFHPNHKIRTQLQVQLNPANAQFPSVNKPSAAGAAVSPPLPAAVPSPPVRPLLKSIFGGKKPFLNGIQAGGALRVNQAQADIKDDEEDEPSSQQSEDSVASASASASASGSCTQPPFSQTSDLSLTASATHGSNTPALALSIAAPALAAPTPALTPALISAATSNPPLPPTATSKSLSAMATTSIHTRPSSLSSSSLPAPSSSSSSSSFSSPSSSNDVPVRSNSFKQPEIRVHGNVYWVLSLIGKGGTSSVYRVLSSDMQLFALKIMQLNGGEKSALLNVDNEIALMKKMKGEETVIQLIDFQKREIKRNESATSKGKSATDDTSVAGTAMKTEYHLLLELGQQDLASYISSLRKKQLHLPVLHLRFYWQQMLTCVSTCHRHGILHLDLKPANFVLVNGILKIIDFGIAKSLGEKEGDAGWNTSVISEQQVGTLNYMSPESLKEKNQSTNPSQNAAASHSRSEYKVCRKSDVWSLGCILYQLVYDHTPFSQISNIFQKMMAITDPEYAIPFPSERASGSQRERIDEDLLAVIKLCLNRDVRERASIDELLNHPFLIGNRNLTSQFSIHSTPTHTSLD